MDFLIGRQAILDRSSKTFGYELLYRENVTSNTSKTQLDGDAITKRVIVNAFLNMGVDKIAKRGRVFINFTKDLIIEKVFENLPKEKIVIEVLEDVLAEKEVLKALKEAKQQGYMVALDDFIFKSELKGLVELADIIKIDFIELTREQIKKEVEKYKPYKLKLLAEKIEAEEDYKFAMDLGFSYFQGFFFEKPKIEAKKDIAPHQVTLLKALRIVNDSKSQVEDLMKLIRGDIYLHSKLLAYLNSPFFGLKTRVTSIQKAVHLLGLENTKRWLNILYVSKLAKDKPEELTILSTVRALFASLLSQYFGLDEDNAYNLGMYSLIDSILDVPIEKALKELNFLDEEVKDALSGKQNNYRNLLDFIVNYEEGNFEKASKIMHKYNIENQNINNYYLKAIEFADNIYSC